MIKFQIWICLRLIFILTPRTPLKARNGRKGPSGLGWGLGPVSPSPGAAQPHLKKVRRLRLGLCRLQGWRLGGGEAGLQPHQQDRGGGAAAGGVHVGVLKYGLALWIPVWWHTEETFTKTIDMTPRTRMTRGKQTDTTSSQLRPCEHHCPCSENIAGKKKAVRKIFASPISNKRLLSSYISTTHHHNKCK